MTILSVLHYPLYRQIVVWQKSGVVGKSNFADSDSRELKQVLRHFLLLLLLTRLVWTSKFQDRFVLLEQVLLLFGVQGGVVAGEGGGERVREMSQIRINFNATDSCWASVMRLTCRYFVLKYNVKINVI